MLAVFYDFQSGGNKDKSALRHDFLYGVLVYKEANSQKTIRHEPRKVTNNIINAKYVEEIAPILDNLARNMKRAYAQLVKRILSQHPPD